MSFAITWISCETCAMRYPGDLLAGRFVYELPDSSKLSLNRQFGWCEACLRFVAMEDLSTSEIETNLASLRMELATHKGFLRALSSASKEAVASLTQRISKLERNLLFLQVRTSPPKCLTCGGERVQPFPQPEFSREPYVRLDAGWVHPLCGGEMVTYSENVFVQDVYPLSVFDASGIRIREEDDDW